ncbi:hypothetical protein C4569_03570 [Candidatus Parcubacteria bacterium]|nr:MAG: hypothetical protein C4569_03570 [Candidatus Parcubacteria bacterium]
MNGNKKAHVLLLDGFHKAGVQELMQREEMVVDARDKSMSHNELLEAISNIDFLGVRSGTKVMAEHLEAARNLLAIGRAGVGIDNIDVKSATKKGIVVANAGNETAVAVAELAFTQMLNLSRRVIDADRSIKSGKWEKKKFIGTELRGKTIGVIGYGQTGSLVVKYAVTFGTKVVIYEVDKEKWESNGRFVENIGELYALADIITLHVPLTEGTRNMICAATINQMKKGVKIINLSRGGIVNHQEVFEAIKEKKVGGFAADVFNSEPPVAAEAPDVENVIWTPHIGGQSEEGQKASSKTIVRQFLNYWLWGQVDNAVNLPKMHPNEELDNPGSHRVVVVHKDVPGALHILTGPFYDAGINIADQGLHRTKEHIVFNVIDTDTAVPESLVTELYNLKTRDGLSFVIKVRNFDLKF